MRERDERNECEPQQATKRVKREMGHSANSTAETFQVFGAEREVETPPEMSGSIRTSEPTPDLESVGLVHGPNVAAEEKQDQSNPESTPTVNEVGLLACGVTSLGCEINLMR